MKIAIVTATYKKGDGSTPSLLKRAINSVLKQSHTDWKYFLIGDAYEDQEEFNSFQEWIPSDKIYTENLPISIEREKYPPGIDRWHVSGITPVNVGIQKALEQGFDYVALLDHDDIWYADHLELISEAIEKTHSPFIFTRGIYKVYNYALEKEQSWGIPCQEFNSYLFDQMCVNQEQRINLNYGIGSYPCYVASTMFIKTSVCIDCKTITLRMRDKLAETGKGGVGDSDWWNRIREKMIQGEYEPALWIDHITCANIDEGYSKSNA
jgi:glycosyltransferase involved in cell wall biosynthesis